jgi:hypothetical protein
MSYDDDEFIYPSELSKELFERDSCYLNEIV